MKRRMASLCLAVFVMAAPAAWAESSSALEGSEMTPLLAKIEAAHASEALEGLNPLQTAKQQAGGWDTSCCTQQEINDCLTSVQPADGCYVERITCHYQNICWCQIFCW